ncbi:MAG: peptidylprolyl isomerase [Candidatus Limnocylindrales bacterium]
MTSPKQPPKESLRDRISVRLSTDRSGRFIDDEARHTRNVTWAFYGLIVIVIVVVLGGLAFGFWETNLKPLANVDGTQVGRAEWQDRTKLLDFRATRAQAQVRAGLADGTIASGLANRRLADIDNERPQTGGEVMAGLVDLIFQRQLAEERGFELAADELDAAVAADGGFEEARQVEAIIVLTEEQALGQAATDAGIADARERAEAALAEWRAGGDPEVLAETYAPANYDSGYVAAGDIGDAAWSAAIFELAEGEATDVFESASGEQLIGKVTQIVPAEVDEGFVEAVNEQVGESIHRRNVELEATAAKLRDEVTQEALAAEYEQMRLAEIFIEGNPFVDPENDEGDVRASHILYQPETPLDEDGNPTDLADLPADDPAWEAAREQAEAVALLARSVDDVDARVEAFAQRAQRDSDDTVSGARGGDLGYFTRDTMVPEFSAAIFDAEDPQRGDILGPVRTDFGWHVILFEETRAPLAERVAAVEAALAQEGADFATVAAEYSDGPEAADGGEIGWQRTDQLDDIALLALTAIEPGEISPPIDGADGYRIYQLLEEATRPLEPAAAAVVERTAFEEWFDERRSDAEAEGRISIDDSVDE